MLIYCGKRCIFSYHFVTFLKIVYQIFEIPDAYTVAMVDDDGSTEMEDHDFVNGQKTQFAQFLNEGRFSFSLSMRSASSIMSSVDSSFS